MALPVGVDREAARIGVARKGKHPRVKRRPRTPRVAIPKPTEVDPGGEVGEEAGLGIALRMPKRKPNGRKNGPLSKRSHFSIWTIPKRRRKPRVRGDVGASGSGAADGAKGDATASRARKVLLVREIGLRRAARRQSLPFRWNLRTRARNFLRMT